MNLDSKELHLIIEWFHSIEDTNKSYLEKTDYILFSKITKEYYSSLVKDETVNIKEKKDTKIETTLSLINGGNPSASFLINGKDPLENHPHRWAKRQVKFKKQVVEHIYCLDCGLIDPEREAIRLGNYAEVTRSYSDGDGDYTEIEFSPEVRSEIQKHQYCTEPYSNRHHPDAIKPRKGRNQIIPMTQEQVDGRFGHWKKNNE